MVIRELRGSGSTNNQIFRPTELSADYTAATRFGPLFGPSSGYSKKSF